MAQLLVPVGIGVTGALYLGKLAFDECERQGKALATKDTSVAEHVQRSWAGFCVGAGIFAVSYSAQMASLRRLGMMSARARSTAAGAISRAVPRKEINNLRAFVADIGPPAVQHGSSLTVATVFAGFGRGYYEGKSGAEQSKEKKNATLR